MRTTKDKSNAAELRADWEVSINYAIETLICQGEGNERLDALTSCFGLEVKQLLTWGKELPVSFRPWAFLKIIITLQTTI